jgi:cytochrome c553|tara:strand:+ start:271 stop:597 length:327 start_codon:yes stop_codon:yes gene_type:complete
MNIFFKLLGMICFLLSFQVLAADAIAGKMRYNTTCINCHGPAGKGAASYPKISGKEIPYIIDKLETYRSGTKIGPNSGLMIMMAKPLTDEEIANLAEYLKDAKYKVNN